METRLKSRKVKLLLRSATMLGSVLALAPSARASGFGLREGAADWLGNAFAGAPAKAYDPSTVWTNPAGMALLDDNELEGAVSYIGPSSKFSGHATNPLTGGNVSGVQGGNAVAAAASGAAFGVWDLAPNWRTGFSVTSPYGERTSYPSISSGAIRAWFPASPILISGWRCPTRSMTSSRSAAARISIISTRG